MDKYNSLAEALAAWGGGMFTAIIGATLGRLMWHGREARKGNRKFFGIELLWELPVIFGMVVIGESVVSYFRIEQPISAGVIASLAWFGPRGIEVLFQRWFAKKVA